MGHSQRGAPVPAGTSSQGQAGHFPLAGFRDQGAPTPSPGWASKACGSESSRESERWARGAHICVRGKNGESHAMMGTVGHFVFCKGQVPLGKCEEWHVENSTISQQQSVFLGVTNQPSVHSRSFNLQPGGGQGQQPPR